MAWIKELNGAARAVSVLAIAATVVILYWPTFRWLVESWLSNPYYSHGFLIPVVSAFLVWTKRDLFRSREPSISGAYVLVLAALLFILGYVWMARSLAALSLLPTLAGLLLLFFGTRAALSLAFPLGYLVFMIPFPFVQEVGFSLQDVSVDSSAWLLRTLGLSVETLGPEIRVGELAFTVGLPCSGINTMIALMALAAVYSFLLAGPFYKRALLFVLAFPLAIVANILRVTSIVLVAYNGSVQTALGWYHEVSSLLFFLLAFALLVLIARALKCRLRPGA